MPPTMARGELDTKDEYGSCGLDIDERRHRGCQVEKAPRIPKQCSPLPAARLLQNNVGADQMRCTVCVCLAAEGSASGIGDISSDSDQRSQFHFSRNYPEAAAL
jgi:hypothetical protein